MQFIKLFAPLFFISFSYSASLPELKTKQAIDNIRHISNNGKYTYFQQRTGDLVLSTNYANKVILDLEDGTHFHIATGSTNKKILIEVIKKYHQNINHFNIHEIYQNTVGDKVTKKVADGINPALHLDDTWASFYNPLKKEIGFQPLGSEKAYKVKLNNKFNPYFIPQFDMLNFDSVIYTDINQKGYQAILLYSTLDKKFKTIFKSSHAGMKLEFCTVGQDLIVGEFNYNGSKFKSYIHKIPLFENKDFKKQATVYKSKLPDQGGLLCKYDDVYFIKSTHHHKKLHIYNSEVAKLDLKTNKVKVVTDLKYANQVIEMDNKILVPFRGKFYVLSGSNLTNQDALGGK